MSIHHFWVEDVTGSLLAVGIFAVLLWVPGYLLAWLLNLCEFRGRSSAFRMAFSLPLAVAVCPILTYTLGRMAWPSAVWMFCAAAAAGWLAIQVRWYRRLELPAEWRIFAAIAAGWLALVLFCLLDWQWGQRLYYPTSSFDYALRASLTHAISTTGIPPQSPLIFPGHPVTLRYHYFWLMLCSLPHRLLPQWISARQALIGGTFWCGLALLAMVALCLRLLGTNPAAPLRRRLLAAVALIGITGLDIIPGIFLLFQYALGMMNFVLPSLECWNEYVDWFPHSVVWAPHAVAALIAGLMAFLLFTRAAEARSKPGVLGYGALGGVALASAAGISIWVTFVFAAFLIAWTLVCALKKWHRELAALTAGGVAALIAAAPYLRELFVGGAGGLGPAGGGFPVRLTVRAFSFAGLVPGWPGMGHWTRLVLINGTLLPVNYFLEFGFFFLIARIRWRQYRAGRRPLGRVDLACTVLLATSTLICTFLKSSVIGNNDLGWRGFLPAQFVLLLWAVDVWAGRGANALLQKRDRRWLAACLALGACGTVYDIGIARLFPVLADGAAVPPLRWMAPDRHFGERNYAQREAYEWARSALPEGAVLQYNPEVGEQETAAMLYGDRRAAAASLSCNAVFGGTPEDCKPIVTRLRRLFPPAGEAATASLSEVCGQTSIGLFAVKDTDAIWRNPGSWVWREKPRFANAYVRLFGCATR